MAMANPQLLPLVVVLRSILLLLASWDTLYAQVWGGLWAMLRKEL